MRARIDISEIETATKIRAKYLRALENEEWDLLPGPTYVKSFLRTYAEALGLDAKLLVDEYKMRHQRLSEVEMQPIGAAAAGRERRRTGPVVPRPAIVGIIVLLLVAALYALGQGADDEGGPATIATTPAVTSTEGAGDREPRSSVLRFRLRATSEVEVCLFTGDRVRIDGEVLQAGERSPSIRSRRIRLTLSNSNVTMFIDGRKRPPLRASDGPIGYEITREFGRREITNPRERPVCG